MKQVNRMAVTIIGTLILGNCMGLGLQANDQRLEREKPLPLAELQNPESPSYVPIPYPKNRNEVIVDFHYFIKRNIEYRKRLGKKITDPSDIITFFSELLKKNPKIKIGEILKAKCFSRSSANFYFFFEITDSSGKTLAKVALTESGHYANATFNRYEPLPRIKTLADGLETFREKVGTNNLNHAEEDIQTAKIEYVFFYSGIDTPQTPFRKITLGNAVYYLDFQDHLYQMIDIEPLTRENDLGWELENLKRIRSYSRSESLEACKVQYALRDYLNKKLICIELIE